MGRFWQKRDQKSIFCFRIADFLSKGHMTITPGATPKKFSTPKKNSVSEVGIIFRGSSRILAISGQCPIASKVPLILDRGQQNLMWLAEIWANRKL